MNANKFSLDMEMENWRQHSIFITYIDKIEPLNNQSYSQTSISDSDTDR